MNAPTELEVWRELWLAERPALPDLHTLVEQQTHRLKLLVAGEILVSAVALGATTAIAVRSTRPEWWLLAAAVWFFVAATWIFTLVNRRGIWKPVAPTTSAFIGLSIRRCRVMLRDLAFGFVFGLAEAVFNLGWVYRYLSHEGSVNVVAFLASPVMLTTNSCLLLLAGGLCWYRRKKLAELACLLDLQRQLDE